MYISPGNPLKFNLGKTRMTKPIAAIRTPIKMSNLPNSDITDERETGLEPATSSLARKRSTN